MKNVLLTALTISLFALGANAQTDAAPVPAANPNAGEFKFETENHDFGTVKDGDQATWEFKFTNVGKEPILITNVQATCGCTTPKWTKEPVKKGESGVITAVYNSKGRPGAFNKSIIVNSNAKTDSKTLYIKGTVETAPVAEPAVGTPVKKDMSGPMEKKGS